MHAVILERNKQVGRKVARVFASAGATVDTVDDPAQLDVAMADVVCGDAFDAELIAERVRGKPGLRGVLWTAEPLKRSVRYLAETPAIDHVLRRRDFESPPHAWELLLVARRLIEPRPAFASLFAWGARVAEITVRGTADRDAAVAEIQRLAEPLLLPKRLLEMLGEIAHELVMNAVYDAPVDAAGAPKYAADRKAEVTLTDGEHATVRFASDGTVLGLQVCDPFGRLERHHVVDGLARGLAGELDRSGGGAGLGLAVCHHASTALLFDVTRGRSTEVTALLELDVNLRDLRTQAKSLHWWCDG
jgi:hypothetical protein